MSGSRGGLGRRGGRAGMDLLGISSLGSGITLVNGALTNELLTGKAGGQTVIGGTAAGENLTLQSTAHATRGKLLFGTSAYDEVNHRLGIGTASPSTELHISKAATVGLRLDGNLAGGQSGLQLWNNNQSTGVINFAMFGTTEGGSSFGIVRSGMGELSCFQQFLFGTRSAVDLVIGTNDAERLRVTSDGRFYGTALHNNGGSVTGTSNQYVASGTYTPTLTAVANVAASTSHGAQWIRVGNVVTVSGACDVDPTAGAGTLTQLGISLPIASNLAAASGKDCAGTACAAGIVPANGASAAILGDPTNNRAQLQWTASDTANRTWHFIFQYEVL